MPFLQQSLVFVFLIYRNRNISVWKKVWIGSSYELDGKWKGKRAGSSADYLGIPEVTFSFLEKGNCQ